MQIRKIQREVVLGHNNTISSIQEELSLYFNGSLKEFKTPIRTLGTQFQKLVWLELTRVLYGSTKGYKEQAKAISKPTASRAVANANGANQMAIIIPCHRIINSNGSIGGYSGGIARKQWLLEHEKSSKLACVYAGY
jgi:AraC family transcriptional regulator of adaptative response/methylated-DNA-[protein]-cysteine methyltransferase